MIGSATVRVRYEEQSTKGEIRRMKLEVGRMEDRQMEDRHALHPANFVLRSSYFILQTRTLVRPSHSRGEYLIDWRFAIRYAKVVR